MFIEKKGRVMRIDRIDHFVLTAHDVARTCDFYTRALGMELVSFGNGRKALAFGRYKINPHQLGREIDPKAHNPTAGSDDFCLVTDIPLEDVLRHFQAENISIEEGPVARTGATGPIRSLYLRDPDQNLVEVSNY